MTPSDSLWLNSGEIGLPNHFEMAPRPLHGSSSNHGLLQDAYNVLPIPTQPVVDVDGLREEPANSPHAPRHLLLIHDFCKEREWPSNNPLEVRADLPHTQTFKQFDRPQLGLSKNSFKSK